MHGVLEQENALGKEIAKVRSTIIGSLFFKKGEKGKGEVKRMLSNGWGAC